MVTFLWKIIILGQFFMDFFFMERGGTGYPLNYSFSSKARYIVLTHVFVSIQNDPENSVKSALFLVLKCESKKETLIQNREGNLV